MLIGDWPFIKAKTIERLSIENITLTYNMMIGRIVLQIIPMTLFLIILIMSSSSLASATAIPFTTIEKGQSPGELTGTFTKVYKNVQDFASILESTCKYERTIR